MEKSRTLVALVVMSGLVCGQEDRPTVAISGRVIDVRGEPIEGAVFTTGALAGLLTSRALAAPECTTGEDGRFRVDLAATPGRLWTDEVGFLVVAPGRAAVRQGVFLHPYDAEGEPADESHDVGDVVLPEGIELRGQVRAVGGAPIAGALVRAVDLLQVDRFFPQQANTYSAVRTERDGRFSLPGVPRVPLALLVRAAGHYDRMVHGIDPALAVVVELQPSGYVEGTLLDSGGKAVAGKVFLDYGRYVPGFRWDCRHRRTGPNQIMPCQVEATAPDGTFRATIRFPGFYRLHGRGRELFAQVSDEVRNGPARGVELRLPAAKRLTVTAVDDATGERVTDLRGMSFWAEHSLSPSDPRWAARYQVHRADGDGRLTLPGPSSPADTTGYVFVFAPDHAPAELREIELPSEPVTVRLVRPGGLELRLIRPTREPVVGARVVVRRRVEAAAGRPAELQVAAPESGAGGLIELSGLIPGTHVVQPLFGAPAFEAVTVEVAAGATARAEVVLAPAWAITGRIEGTVPADAKLQLAARHEQELPAGMASRISYRRRGTAAVGEDAGFAFSPQASGTYRLTMMLPDVSRPGDVHVLQLAQFEHGEGAEPLSIALPDPVMCEVRGTIDLGEMDMPPGRLIVAAESSEQEPDGLIGGDPREAIARMSHVAVERDGSFRLTVPTGPTVIGLFDAVTGLELHRQELELDRPVHRVDMAAYVARVAVDVVDAEGERAPCHALQVRLPHAPVDSKPEPGTRSLPVSSSVWIGDRLGPVHLLLPPGRVELAVTQGVWTLQESGSSRRLGEAVITVPLERPGPVRLVIEPLGEPRGG